MSGATREARRVTVRDFRDVSVDDALLNAGRVAQETGAQAVKLEGAGSRVLPAVAAIVKVGIPVVGHRSLTPQSVHGLGGARARGREEAAAVALLDDVRGGRYPADEHSF